jgi:membrane-associated phospholipid phosphatase
MALPTLLAPTMPSVAAPADAAGRRRLAWAAGLLSVFVLLTILTAAHAFNSPDQALDARIHTFALAHATLVSVTKVVTFFGEPPVALGGGILAAVVCYLCRDQQRAYFFAASSVGAYGIAYIVKEILKRHRPVWPVPVMADTGPTYPSGHATGSNALAVALIIAVVPLIGSLAVRRTAITVLVAYAIIEPVSRLILGVHFPSDVVAGALLGTGWTLLCASLLPEVTRRTLRVERSRPAA